MLHITQLSSYFFMFYDMNGDKIKKTKYLNTVCIALFCSKNSVVYILLIPRLSTVQTTSSVYVGQTIAKVLRLYSNIRKVCKLTLQLDSFDILQYIATMCSFLPSGKRFIEYIRVQMLCVHEMITLPYTNKCQM